MPDDLDQEFSPETLQALGKLALKLSRNDKTRLPFLRQIKEVDPNYRMPADAQVQLLRDELTEKSEKDRIDAAAATARAQQEAERAGLLAGTLLPGRKFDDAQVKEIEGVMSKYGIASYEAGARLYAADLKPAKPSGRDTLTGGTTWTFPDLPGLLDDPAKAAREAAAGVIDELRGRAA